MTTRRLRALIPELSVELAAILDADRSALEAPIRAEIFGAARFQQHARSLAATHEPTTQPAAPKAFATRLRDNIRVLRDAHRFIGSHALTGLHVSPAGEWLLDNFHLVEAQLKEIHDGLPNQYFKHLPVLADVHLAGLPRVYGVAWAFIAHTDSAFNEDLLVNFLDAYQEARELTLGELWAVPTTLRVVLVENLRRLAERVAASKAARELANLCCDHLERFDAKKLDAVRELMEARGVVRPFLLQMSQRLHDQRAEGTDALRDWLARVLPDTAHTQALEQAEQTADNLSVSNAIGSLRSLGDTDWRELISRTSLLMRLMDESAAFRAERDDTQDETLHAIERLARRSRRSELLVGRTVLDLMHEDKSSPELGPATAVPGHWLRGPGRPVLQQALGLPVGDWLSVDALRRLRLPAYLSAVAAGSVALVVAMFADERALGGAPWLELLAALLLLFPASEAIVAIVNRLISESARPTRLPRLALDDGIPAAHGVLVVIPAMLDSAGTARALAGRLELHYLANAERHAQFALLTDWPDAAGESTPEDGALLDAARTAVGSLNDRHPSLDGDPTRFLLLHRRRRHSETEQCWMGWERKRGKLEQLVARLSGDAGDAFIDLGVLSALQPGTPYVVTLDADTGLPPGRLRELVGVAAHPHNQPRVDAQTHRVTAGYGILQPRVVTPLPRERDVTWFHWLFAGQSGIDPYSAASSEVYQDVFGEGSFVGKGLLHVRALHLTLSGRLPEGSVLSHDLLEGAVARCASVSDISLVEDAPVHADVAAARVHRWTRGDWQLLPLLLPALLGGGRFGLSAVNRWKMLDNLRRSLVAPMSLAALLLTFATGVVSPLSALMLVLAAFCAGPLMGALAGLAPSRDELAVRYFYRRALADVARALWTGAWGVAQLLSHARLLADAVLRTLWRLVVSRRRLLQWTTAAAVQARAATRLSDITRKHAMTMVIASLLLAAAVVLPVAMRPLAIALCLLWAASPLWVWLASRPHADAPPLPQEDRAWLHGVARDTWRLFERFGTADENFLPPDNLQTWPQTMTAHRTSPTNIGLYLLSTCCARQFGWIGTQELLTRLEDTLGTLAKLERHRGHFLNWYDTQTLKMLPPAYVSTVDSGNLSGHLLATAQSCLELAEAPYDRNASLAALSASRERLRPLLGALSALKPEGPLLEMVMLDDAIGRLQRDPAAIDALLQAAARELDQMRADDPPPLPPITPRQARRPADALASLLRDHLLTLRSLLRDVTEASAEPTPAERLRAVAQRCQRLAWEPEFGFLYDRRRKLLHIGLRVAEQQLDNSYYDLLASESRLTSLLAIAKGDVPVAHWATLGRPFHATGSDAGLRSWSGSMFEYLMPTLTLDEPPGSVLHGAGRAAVAEQIAFGDLHGVPWGISESAYAASDHTLAYQYAPQGVPRLALRRTPPDELVIAPYATALALQVDPQQAAANLRRIEGMGARDMRGFIEALDFTPERHSGDEAYARVSTFMAHHQGMSLVALANLLLDAAPRRWGMADPRVQAVESLLHERAPREVSALIQLPTSRVKDRRARISMRQQVTPGATALQPTHLLSNGHYALALRANGAGWSQHGSAFITRWRDDVLRDAHGSFIFIRRSPEELPVSITQHPAPDAAAEYQSTFHADRVCLDADWPDLQSRCTVWVSPEDDIELRRVELRNTSDQPIELELISYLEASLSEARADESHPAFANLFVRARWDAADRALYLERKPRLATEAGLHAVHFLAESDASATRIRVQTDRQRWLGRHRDLSCAIAHFGGDDSPRDEEVTGLDPIASIGVRLRIAPHGKARLTFATAASTRDDVLPTLVDKYSEQANVERSSLMSATLAGIRLREMRITAETFAAIQTLTTPLALTMARESGPLPLDDENAGGACDRRLLWRFGISGDRPILLVSAGVAQGMSLLRALVHALRLWSWSGLGCDLVVVNSEPASYLMPLRTELASLRERYAAESDPALTGSRLCGLHVLMAGDLTADELATLRAVARVRLNADGRPLSHHVDELIGWHDQALDARQARSTEPVPVPADRLIARKVPAGRFDSASGEFRFDLDPGRLPTRPWINVLSNPAFGTQVSEVAAGYTWARNSRLNQLTAWSNDPVSDPSGESLLLQDLRTRQVWRIGAAASGETAPQRRISHGQGETRIEQRFGDLSVRATWCVDTTHAVKQVRISLANEGARTLRLRAVSVVEWIMGAARSDRLSTRTLGERIALDAAQPQLGHSTDVLFCTQRERHAGFGGGTAFIACTTSDAELARHLDWSCDRREFFDARGRMVLPDELGRRAGAGLDPCAALAIDFALAAGERSDIVFLLGYADSPATARLLAREALRIDPVQRQAAVRQQWDGLLGAVTVATPDPLFDAMVNRWLLYQTITCRLWGRAGFYQAGGAFGFRDQLQDAMSLAVAAPQMLRAQIVLNASRQFPEGDVQHWWHAPTGAGVRTHFSDDLLWLAHALVHYLDVTGDRSVLDEVVPFLEGPDIPPGQEDLYNVPGLSEQSASVYEHCARTLDRSLRTGAHGLPLMGTGDWNDGMNRVGHEGRGESVWVGWFLCRIVREFVPIAREVGDIDRAAQWEQAARQWQAALSTEAWDGAWFKRAFFDDGSPLGSSANSECRIDLIAQAWSVLSGAASSSQQASAMASAQQHLVDREHGLVRLLHPPLADAVPSAGYIQAYPPGVRENGGQYSHAGVWALMAHAERGEAGEAWHLFTCLSPAHRWQQPAQAAAYALEPYVMAGDVYTQAPYIGRGGWSWYTGSAAWMYRAGIESLCGLRLRHDRVSLRPCLPPHWPAVSITLRRAGRRHEFIVCTPEAARGIASPVLAVGEWLALDALEGDSTHVVIAPASAPSAADRAPAASHA